MGPTNPSFDSMDNNISASVRPCSVFVGGNKGWYLLVVVNPVIKKPH
jgi:hypothetical protein